MGEFNDGSIRNQLISESGNALDFAEMIPKQLDGLGWCPKRRNAGSIFSRSVRVKVPYVFCKWAIISAMETVANPKVASSRIVR